MFKFGEDTQKFEQKGSKKAWAVLAGLQGHAMIRTKLRNSYRWYDADESKNGRKLYSTCPPCPNDFPSKKFNSGRKGRVIVDLNRKETQPINRITQLEINTQPPVKEGEWKYFENSRESWMSFGRNGRVVKLNGTGKQVLR